MGHDHPVVPAGARRRRLLGHVADSPRPRQATELCFVDELFEHLSTSFQRDGKVHELRRRRRGTARVTGEAGIGKMTAAAALALRFHAEGGLVLYGRWDQAGASPYHAWREALGSYANAASTEVLRAEIGDWTDAIERLLPEVVARFGARTTPGPADPERDRLALSDAIHEWLVRIAVRLPTLLVLDDLHWADLPSLLRQHPGELDPHRLVGDTGWRGEERRARRLVRLAWAAVATSSNGTESRAEEGEHRWAASCIQDALGAFPDQLDAAALPAALRAMASDLGDVVGWRLAQLPPEVHDFLRAASLVGAHVDVDLLTEATGMSPFAVQELVEAARRAGLLRTADDRTHTASPTT